jgi:hypothetical protein
VASGEIPRIQPVHRSVAVASQVEMRWTWNGRLTYTNDHAKVPKNIASGNTWEPCRNRPETEATVRSLASAQRTATRLPPRRLASATEE